MTTLQSKLPAVGTTIFTRMSALAAEHGAINLSQGFPDFDAPQALREAIGRHVMAGHNQYSPMQGHPLLREQIARHIAHYRDVAVDADSEITVVPGATEGIFCAVMAAVRPGDEVIVLDPAYDSYQPSIELAGGTAVHVPLNGENFRPDWSLIAAAITPRCRMIMINSPHNPCGSVFDDDDMLQLQALAEHHDLLVCSDEVYEHLVFDGHQHRSVLQYPQLRQRSFAHFSFGKTYSVTGWKTGYCVAPPALTAELRKVHQFVAFVAVTPVQLALADFMRDNIDYAGSLAAEYQARRDTFLGGLIGSRFSFTPSAGSYFQLLDYSDINGEQDQQLADNWTRELGVASIPISVFYEQPPTAYKLRFCFAKRESVLLQAAEILCKI